MTGDRSVLGLDIGGTKIAAGVVGPDGRVSAFVVAPTHSEEGPDPVLRRLFELGRAALVADTSSRRISAVGISCGGPLDPRAGVLVAPPHLPGWLNIPVVARTSAFFGMPAFLENDATAAALGEYRHGAGRGTRSMLYLTLSTGVGGGAVMDGRLHRGAANNGGEFGHVIVERGGRACSCGRRGCLEAYVSGSSIAARARDALDAGRPSSLSRHDPVTAAHVAAAAGAGDPLARHIWNETTDLLGSALTDLVNAFEPDLVVLGGGVTRSGAMLLEPARAVVLAEAMPPARAAVDVVLTEFGDQVGVVGAAAVAFERLAEQNDAVVQTAATAKRTP